MDTDYISLAKKFYSATKIPVTLMKGKQAVYNSFNDMIGITPVYYREYLFPMEGRDPCFCSDSPDIVYGRLKIEETDYNLILGPVFSVPLTDELIRQNIKESGISLEKKEQFTEFLYAIPRLSQVQFANYLVFLHQCLNHKDIPAERLFLEDSNTTLDRMERQTDHMVEDKEEGNLHNSYYFELELYQMIKNGNVDGLKKFLTATRLPLKEGKMADSPLRHAKNIFISATVKAGMMGAIPGGVDIEKTYQLIDYYVQECEQIRTIEKLKQLQYVMLLDFCRRAGETRIPEGISPDVYACMTYIRNHTNESISVEDAAAHTGRSVSYMMKHFKSELGIHMGAYIMRCKLEEAKSLLTYSEKSLAEISSYLCFSSQSYFQNVFKKQYGVTPLQYRKQTRKPSN